MRFLAFFCALLVLGSACIGGGGSQCCAQSQPSCNNPCGGGFASSAVGPAPYIAPQQYALPAGNAYAVGK